MKYYIVFINTLDGFKVVSISSYEDYETQQQQFNIFKDKLDQYGLDWLGFPQIEYHEIQLVSEVY